MNWRSALIGMTMLCSAIVLTLMIRRGLERRAVYWLTFFVASANISAVPTMIGFAGAYDIWPGLTFLPTQTALFLGPAIALHGQALMLPTIDRRSLALLVPGAVYWVYQLWAFTMLGDYRAKWAFNDSIHEPYIYPLAMTLAAILVVGNFVYTWRLRSRYLEWLANNRSDDEQFSPVWLTHLVVLSALAGLFWGFETIASQWFGLNYYEAFIWSFLALFAIFVIALESLATIDHPFPKMRGSNEDPGEEDAQQKGRDWLLEGTRLKAAVLENKWHLDPSLSLKSLARRFGTNQAYLSRAINQGLDVNFSTFINGLRVDSAKSLIVGSRASMIEIALASGFASKASFNRSFKRLAGCSPSEFRAKHAAIETAQKAKA